MATKVPTKVPTKEEASRGTLTTCLGRNFNQPACGLIMALGAMLICLASMASAATRTWTGTAIGNVFWNNATNWGLILPVNGDNLFFPLLAGNKSSVNNLGVTNYGTLYFAGSNYVFNGGVIGLSGGIVATNRDGTNTFVTPLLLRASQTFTNGEPFGGPLQIAGSLNLNGNNLTLQGGGDVRVLSSIVGTGDIIKDGFGDLFLHAANSFTGTLFVALSSVFVRHPLALGDTNFPVVVTNITRRLFLGTNIVVTNKSLQLGPLGELWGEGGTNGWTGPITLAGANTLLRLDNGGVLRLGGVIAGAQDWHLVGPGTALLEGSQANTTSGDWDLRDGVTVLLDKTPGLSSAHRYVVAEGSTVRLLASDQLSNTRSLILSDGTLDLNGFSDTIAFLTDSSTNGSGQVLFGSSGTNTLVFGNTSSAATFSGRLSGAGDLLKTGSSTWTLRGTNDSTGDTIVTNGTFVCNGRINGPTLVYSAGFTGTGTVAALTLRAAGGVLTPGQGGTPAGRLRVTGPLSLLGGSASFSINGTVPGVDYPQLVVDGSTFITNANLVVSLGFAPAPGTSFVLITNTAPGAVHGQFNGFIEGAVLDAGGTLLRISYLGGTGNDITLTVVTSTASGVTRQWSGAGANNFWLTALNWVGGTRPSGGDSLYFPPGAARLLNTNDFPPLLLDTILAGGSGYDLRGGDITLLGGLRATNVSGAVIVRTPLTLAGSLALANSSVSGTLNIPAPIQVGPHQLSMNATGSVILSGLITGSGTLVKSGPGQVVILGTNSLSGTSLVHQGSLFVDGAFTAGGVQMFPGTALGGSGFMHRLESLGVTFRPGEDSAPARFAFNDNARFSSDTAITLELDNATAGSGYSQLAMTNLNGFLALSNTMLTLDLRFSPTIGTAFTLIDKAGVGPVQGTFAGLPEGSVFGATNDLGSNHLFRITYTGGTGNDVVATLLYNGPTGIERIWTGGGLPNTNWSNPLNWSDNVLPGAGDSLVFPGTSPGRTNFNNLGSNIVFQSLRFATGAANYRINGAANLLLAGGVTATNLTAGPTILAPLQLVAAQSISMGGAGMTFSAVVTDGHQLTVSNSPIGLLITGNGVISGSGGLTKTGPGTLFLTAVNTYTGPTLVEQGSLLVQRSSGLGGTNNGTTVMPGASVGFGNFSLVMLEPLTLGGTLTSGFLSNSTWAGFVTLASTNAILEALTNANSAGSLRVSGPVSGTNGFRKAGNGPVRLSASNTFEGPAHVAAGRLILENDFALGTGHAIVTNGARLETAAGSSLTVNNPLTLYGTLAVLESATTLWVGETGLESANATMEVGEGSLLDFAGRLEHAGGLIKTGPGQLVIRGESAYLGPTVVQGGTLTMNTFNPDSPVTVNAGATLNGDGQLAAVTSVGGRIDVTRDSAPSILRALGGLTLDSASTLAVTLTGTNVGNEFSQLRVNGAVNLGGAALDVTLLYTPVEGDLFEVVRNDGIDSILGTLAGVAQNGLLQSGGFVFRVNYSGGDGNDVVLTALFAAPTGVLREWTGAGIPNTNWSNAANWVGNALPQSGDNLFFPGTIENPRKTNFFDLPDIPLHRLVFANDQCRYRIFGVTALQLHGGIEVTNTTFGPSFSVPIQLLQGVTFSNAGPSGLRVTSVITDGHPLVWDGPGSMVVEGNVSGSGPLFKRGAGPIAFNGASTFTSVFTLEAGILTLGNNSGLGNAGVGTVAGVNGTIRFSGGARTVAEALTLEGTLDAQARIVDRWAGPLSLAATGGTINVDTQGVFTVSGSLGGIGMLLKTGLGTLALTGTNANTGETLVQAGTLLIGGVHTSSVVTVQSGAVLSGTGTVASATCAGGTLSPGTVGEAGLLAVRGDLTFTAGGGLRTDVDGLAPGMGFDQVRVSGGVQLGDAPLQIALGFLPPTGASFEILRKETAGPIQGTFAGLAEGTTFNTGIFTWQITYAGGDGNDVVVTVVNTLGIPAERVWTGAGVPNTNWSNPLNWSGDVAPASGDALVFPGGVQGTFNFNDLAADAFFHSMRFSTGFISYAIRSVAEVPLLSGISLSNTTQGTPFLGLSVRQLADQTFAAEGDGLILGGLETGGHQATFGGTGTVSLDRFFINNQQFNPVISGAGSVRKVGAGTLLLGGTNTYTGATAVESGVVELRNSLGLGSPASGTTVQPGAILEMRFGSFTVPEPLELEGILNVGNSVQNCVWSGPITLASSGATMNIGTNGSLRVTGLVSGTGGLVKTGMGTLLLDADNNYEGATAIELGALIISNSHLAGPITVNTTNSALALGGAAGAVMSQGGLLHAGVPGSSFVFLNTAGTPGAADVSGLTLDAGTRLVADIAGAIAGSGFDQWRVAGDVASGDARLILNILVITPVGSAFTLIRNDGLNPASGAFAALPEGTEFERGAYRWRISYTGGDGNDVVLSVVGQVFAGQVWDGGGADANWSSALNWVGDAVPLAGADLVFPLEANLRTNVNDFPPGTAFGGLRFTGAGNVSGGYQISGNAILLNGPLVAGTNSGTTRLGMGLTLGSAAPWVAEASASLTLTGAIHNAGFDLNLTGPGAMTFNASISGGGGLISGAGLVQLRSNSTFTGSSLVTTGSVRLDADAALGAPGNLVTVESGGRLQLVNAVNVPNPLVLRGRLESSRTNRWSGPITADGLSAAIGFPGTGPLTLAGGISGSGELRIESGNFGSHVAFEALNPYTGRMLLATGTLLVTGTGTGSALHIATNQSFLPTVLTGTGTVSSVFVAGTISPGLPSSAGSLNVAGSLVLSNSALLELQLNGLIAGTDYDQLRVSGDVTIQDATLRLTQLPAFMPSLGAMFVLIRKDSPGAVNGVFAGLPEGGFVTNCSVFQISYAGGDGNDVTLTVTALKGLSNLWTGNGPDANWTTPGNWLCGLAPVPGDELVFDTTVSNRLANNDFPPGTSFRQVRVVTTTFLNTGFNFTGNAFTLTEGIAVEAFSGSNVFHMPVTMNAPMTFSNNAGPLVFGGGIINNGHTLQLKGTSFDFLGPYSGAGGLSFVNTNNFFFGFLYLRVDNPYAGPTVLEGLVYVPVDTPGGLGDPAAGTHIGPGASVVLQSPMTLVEPITLAGQLSFSTGTNVLAAPLVIEGTNAMVCGSVQRLDFDGPIEGSGRLLLCGFGTTLYNTGGGFEGVFEIIFSGHHSIIGQYPGTELRIAGDSLYSATLAGAGRLGGVVAYDMENNSVIAPGVNGPGVLTVEGHFIIESNITVRLELNGTTPGTGHDQLVVGGPVVLTQATLELSAGFTPGPNDSFLLLRNEGANPVEGFFNGLSEGALITIGGTTLQLTYAGGDGNDIELRPPSVPGAVISSLVCLPDGTKQFQILGQPNAAYIIEATPNLLSPPELTPWLPIATNTTDDVGLLLFIDFDSTNFTQRFYRTVGP